MLSCYAQHRARLNELQTVNQGAKFDYASATGNKAARSYVFSLRKEKGAIDATRKAEKAESLRIGREVDKDAASLTAELDEMIELHQRVIDRLEAAEFQRVTGHTRLIESAKAATNEVMRGWMELSCERIAEVQALYDTGAARDYEEYADAAAAAFGDLDAELSMCEAKRHRYQTEQAELVRLRADAVERERLVGIAAAEQAQKDRDARIAQDAADAAAAKAQRDAEKVIEAQRKAADAAAQAERDAAAQREREANERAAAAERELESSRRAALAAQAEAERLAADEQHRAHIHGAIAAALVRECGVTLKFAARIVEAVGQGSIENVRICY